MTTKKLLCAAVVLTTVLTGCSSAPVKTEKKDKTEEVSKKKTKDSKKETKKNSEKDETAKNEEKTKEAAKIAEKDTKEAQKQHTAETKKAVETTHNKDQQTNHKTESTTQKHEDNKVENTVSKPATSSKPSDSKPSNQNKDEHKHNWEKVTTVVHHEAVTHTEQVLVRDAWTENIYGTKFICQGCEQIFNTENELTAHQQYYMEQDNYTHTGAGTLSGVVVDTIYHPAEYETRTVVDKEAYDETVVTGYKCTICGATK